jgi:hypothetical protein
VSRKIQEKKDCHFGRCVLASLSFWQVACHFGSCEKTTSFWQMMPKRTCHFGRLFLRSLGVPLVGFPYPLVIQV